MAVASDLPQIENRQQYGARAQLLPVRRSLAPDRDLRAAQPRRHRHLPADLAKYDADAIVVVEDKRFWTDPGVDIRGIARAFVADVTGGATPGRLDDRRAVRQERAGRAGQPDDPREAARGRAGLPPHPQVAKTKILREYLNSIYFGNGAYGIESAARVYFGRTRLGYNQRHRPAVATSGCGDAPRQHLPSCASVLRPVPGGAAGRDGRQPDRVQPGRIHPSAAKARRNLVLQDMLAQGYITRAAVRAGHPRAAAAPPPISSSRRSRPRPRTSPAGCGRRSWRDASATASRQGRRVPRLLRRPEDPHHDRPADAAGGRAGDLQQPARPVRASPTASLVAIDNRTGEVRAMVGGPLVDGQQDYRSTPSTSPPRATASRARRSSRSRWRSRSSTGTRPTR